MIILGTNSIKAAGGFNVDNSLRFNDGSQDSLQRSPSSASNRRTWTWSGWIKRSNLGADQIIFSGGSANTWIRLLSSDKLEFNIQDNDESTIVTTQLFRDISAWSHIVVAIDTTQGTDTNRIKFYVNGNQVTSFSTSVYVSQNYEAGINNTGAHYIGRLNYAATQWFDGYMSEVCFIDGQQLAADQFGEFDEDSGIWKPIKVSGLTFGDEGFYLEFKGSGTSANSSGLGADTSGNDHHFTVNNLTALDQSTDTCTNNFCTFTSTDPTASAWALSEGNLKCQRTTGTSILFGTSIMPTTGKWYFEVKIGEAGNSDRSRVGVMNYQSVIDNSNYTGVINTPSQVFKGVTTSCKVGKHFEGTGSGVTEYTASGDFADDDIVQFALDLDNKAIYIGRNGTFLTKTGNSGGDPTSGASKTGAISTNTTIFDGSPMTVCTGLSVGSGTDTSTMFFNFGSPPYAISSGNADADGHGNFEFAVPSGYFALCSKNLAEYG